MGAILGVGWVWGSRRVRFLYLLKDEGVEVHRGEFRGKRRILSFGCNLGWVGGTKKTDFWNFESGR